MSNWNWYAQSKSTFYTAEYVQNYNDNTKKFSSNEYKPTDFINIHNIGPQGINKYGITLSNKNEEQQLISDFSISSIGKSDFIYTTPTVRNTYTFNIMVEYIKDNVTCVSNFSNFSKYISHTEQQQNSSEIQIEDIFIHKFGHVDVSINSNQQEMVQDGYSIGYKAKIAISKKKILKIVVRGDLDFATNTPRFIVNISSDFDCKCVLELKTNDLSFNQKIKKLELNKNRISVTFNNQIQSLENTVPKNDIIKNELRSISRFIDWRFLPSKFVIDWDNDNIDKISSTFLEIANYINNREESNMIISNKYFTIVEFDKLQYVNIKYNAHIAPKFIYTHIGETDETPITVNILSLLYLDNNEYGVTKDALYIKGKYCSLEYEFRILGHDTDLPIITFIFKENKKCKIQFIIESDLKIADYCNNISKEYILDNETLEFTTTK